MPAENRDYTRDIILRISPKRGTFSVEEQKEGGITAYKEISPIDLYYAINGSYRVDNMYFSGMLPENCIHVALSSEEKCIVLRNPELRADLQYNGQEYLNFPLPRLVFKLRILENGKVAECFLGVMADEQPTPDTPMYHYPFSNVHPDGRVCTGNNIMPRYQRLTSLRYFPRYLLELPDNDDMYSRKKNQLALDHQELMDHLKDKPPAYYYSDILIPSGQTLMDFINGRITA